MPKRLDIKAGERYGHLIIICEIKKQGQYRCFQVKCDCGKILNVILSSLRNGHTKSCGCIISTANRKSATRLYGIWYKILRRCKVKNSENYAKYGAKGIDICDEWLCYEVFEKWAYANGYQDKLSIDRINNKGNYEPSNCRWTNHSVQNANKSFKSQYKYVGVGKSKNKWRARLTHNLKEINIGYFSTEIEAVKARNEYILANKLHHNIQLLSLMTY